MTAYRIISADSHFVGPPTMWAERMDQKFRDRAPHTVRGYNGQEGEFFVCENITPVPVAGFSAQGRLPKSFLNTAGKVLRWLAPKVNRFLRHVIDQPFISLHPDRGWLV